MAGSNLGYRMQIANVIMADIVGYRAGRERYFTSNPLKMAKRLARSALGIVATPVVAPVVYSVSALLAGRDSVRESITERRVLSNTDLVVDRNRRQRALAASTDMTSVPVTGNGRWAITGPTDNVAAVAVAIQGETRRVERRVERLVGHTADEIMAIKARARSQHSVVIAAAGSRKVSHRPCVVENHYDAQPIKLSRLIAAEASSPRVEAIALGAQPVIRHMLTSQVYTIQPAAASVVSVEQSHQRRISIKKATPV